MGNYFNNDNIEFGKLNEPQRVFVSWGLLKQDVQACNQYDFECVGETVFDDDFRMDDNETQLSLLVKTPIVRCL